MKIIFKCNIFLRIFANNENNFNSYLLTAALNEINCQFVKLCVLLLIYSLSPQLIGL